MSGVTFHYSHVSGITRSRIKIQKSKSKNQMINQGYATRQEDMFAKNHQKNREQNQKKWLVYAAKEMA